MIDLNKIWPFTVYRKVRKNRLVLDYKNPIKDWIKLKWHNWHNLQHCHVCGGKNDFYERTGILEGWCVSNTCKKCLKEQADAVAQCQKCGYTGPRGQAYFLKYPDAGPCGNDVELFACEACAKEYGEWKAKIRAKVSKQFQLKENK